MADTDVEIPLEDGPWDGMLDSLSPTARSPGKYLLAQNTYPLDPEVADGMVGRPGVIQAGAQLGSVGFRRGQGTFEFHKRTGARFTVQIVGGQFYTYDWATSTWNEVVTAANFAAKAIVLDRVARVRFLEYQDVLVVSDGVNKLWTWDGTAGAGGLTLLTNSEAMYGQIRAYFARILGISAVNRDVLLWSEADNANLGYRSGGYNNAWSLTQNDPDILYSILTTNEAVYVLRARGGTTLTGEPGPAFASQSTRDSLSDTFGTVSPDVTTMHDVNIMVLDADAHPQLLRPGAAGFIPIWREFRETTKRLSRNPAILEKAMCVYYSPAGLYLLAVPDSGQAECTMMLVYDAKGSTPVPVAVWRGWEMTSLAMVENANGQPYLMHSDSTGRVYLHGNPDDDAPWDDFMATGTVAVEHIHECQPLGHSTKREKIFDRLDITTRGRTQQTLELSLRTPQGQSAAQVIVIGASYLGYDSGIYDDPSTVYDPGADTTEETHGDVGLDGAGRWGKPKVRHQTLGEQFSLVALTLLAYSSDDDPEAP
jgi:hypothetical protein